MEISHTKTHLLKLTLISQHTITFIKQITTRDHYLGNSYYRRQMKINKRLIAFPYNMKVQEKQLKDQQLLINHHRQGRH